MKILGPDSPLQEHVMNMAQGLPASDELLKVVGQYVFAPVTERRQEGDHAIINKFVSKRSISPAYVSLTLRMPEMETLIWSSSSQSLQRQHTLLKYVSELSHADTCAQFFHMQNHPEYETLMVARACNRDKLGLLSKLLYQVDMHSQFASYREQRQQREIYDRRLHAMVQKVHTKQGRSGGVVADVLRESTVQHLRARCDLGRFYSLSSTAIACIGLATATSTQRPAFSQDFHVSASDEEFVSDTARSTSGAAIPSLQTNIFCKFIRMQPSRSKLPSASSLVASRLSSSDIAITLHACVGSHATGPTVAAEPHSCSSNPIAIMSLERTEIVELIDGLCEWTGASLSGQDPDLKEVLFLS